MFCGCLYGEYSCIYKVHRILRLSSILTAAAVVVGSLVEAVGALIADEISVSTRASSARQ